MCCGSLRTGSVVMGTEVRINIVCVSEVTREAPSECNRSEQGVSIEYPMDFLLALLAVGVVLFIPEWKLPRDSQPGELQMLL